MRRAFFLSLLVLLGCNHYADLKSAQLADTIEKLRKLSDYRPLVEPEAYAFLNKYYLSQVDTLRPRRKIYIYPINPVDYKAIFSNDKRLVEQKHAGDTTLTRQPQKTVPPPPPSVSFDINYKWDSTRLSGIKIITDTADQPKTEAEWHKKFGTGYMCISYPLYNPNTKILTIREWHEDFNFCGTGQERIIVFAKIPGGWKPIRF